MEDETVVPRVRVAGQRLNERQRSHKHPRLAALFSLECHIVGQLVAKNAFLANLTVFRTSNKMLGSLLNSQG